MTARILLVAVLLGLLALAPTSASAKQNDCGSFTTKNGGRAEFIIGTDVNCKISKKVARKATGKKRYSAKSFDCKLSGGFYACSSVKLVAGLAFKYTKP